MANDYPVEVDAPASIAVQSNTPRAITEFSIQDGDAESTPEQIYTVSLNPTHGSLSLGSDQGLTMYDQPILGTGTIGPNGEATFEFTAAEGTLLFTGTIADINAALQTLTFTPDSGYTGPAAVEMTVMDAPPGGGPNATSDRQTITVSIGAVASITGLDGDGVFYNEGDAPLAIDVDGDATVNGSDFNGTTLRFEITVNEVASEDLLDIDQTNGVTLDQGYVDGGTVRVDGVAIGVMVIEGAAPGSVNTPGEAVSVRFNANATAADVERLIHSVTYVNLNVYEPSGAGRTLTTTLTTADLVTETFTSTIDVVPDDDDAPLAVDLDANAGGLNAAVTFTEDAGAVLLAPDAAVTDDAARDIAGGSLTVSVDASDSFDQLVIADQGVGAGLIHVDGNTLSENGVIFATFSGGTDGAPLVIDFAADGGGAVASAHLEALYRAIGYASSSEDPQGTRTVTFALDDGYLLGNPAPVSTTVTLVAVNDVPVVDLNGDAESGTDSTAEYYENATATALAPDLVLSDADDTLVQSASVAITDNWDAASDVLLVNGLPSGTVGAISFSYDIMTGMLEFTGSATLAEYQDLLRQVGFQSASDTPGTSRAFTWVVNDDDSYGFSTTTLTVFEDNDTPTIDNLEGDTAAYVEEGGPVHLDVDGDAFVADLDNANFDGGLLTIEIVANHATSEDILVFDTEDTGIMFNENDDGTAFLVMVDEVVIGEMPFEYGAQGDSIGIALNENATPEVISRLIQALTYDNLNMRNPSTATRTVEIHLRDSSGPDADSITIQTFITVEDIPEVNHAPVLDLNGGTAGIDVTRAYTENGAAFRIATSATLTDSDDYVYNGGSLTIAVTDALTSDRLTLINHGTVRFYDNVVDHGGSIVGTFSGGTGGTPLVITFLPDLSPADTPEYTIADIVRAVAYASSSDSPPTSRTITFTLDDGGGREFDGQVASATATINIARVNDVPVVGNSPAVTTTEQTLVTINPALTVSDPELSARNGGAGDFGGAVFWVQRNGLPSDDDSFSIDTAGASFTIDGEYLKVGGLVFARFLVDSGGLQIGFTSTGTPATSALVNEVISRLQYGNLSDAPPASVQLFYAMRDGAPGGDQGTVVGGTVAGTQGSGLVTVNITPVDDPVALNVADTAVGGTEDTDLVFNAANGNAITVADPDGDALTVTLDVTNGTLTLAQTTGLVVTGDGSGSVSLVGSAVDINAALEGLVYRGALNFDGADSLFVEVSDSSSSASETIAITLADDGQVNGDADDNALTGTAGADLIWAQQGGSDTLTGLGGNDGFYMGGALDAGDVIDGGDDVDQVGLQGNYGTFGIGATPFQLGAGNLTNVEQLVLLSGAETRFGDASGSLYSYNLQTVDANVGLGERLVVSFNQLRAGENVRFDGSLETDGSFITYGGNGNDDLIGGQQSDGFFFGLASRWGAGDRIDGQGGTLDQLGLQGRYSDNTAITFGADQLTSIEMIVLVSGGDVRFGSGGLGYSYDLTMNDGNVADGALMMIQANSLLADEVLTFNGSAELDGRFHVWGGAAGDYLTGGAGDDMLWGRGGVDFLYGGNGNDTINGGADWDYLSGGDGDDVFVYSALTDSNELTGVDFIVDFAAGDRIDLSAIDAITGGANDAFSFIGSAAFGGTPATAGQLRAVFDSGVWQVEGDVDGDGVADFALLVATIDPSYTLTGADFSL